MRIHYAVARQDETKQLTKKSSAHSVVFRVGDHILYRGDSTKILTKLPSNEFDVIVTSPPYNIGLGYKTYRDQKGEEDYLRWMVNICCELRRVMKPDGSFFLNIGGTSSQPWLPFELMTRLRHLFILQNQITWIKSVSIENQTYGHFKPVNSQRYLHHNHEWIFHLTRDGQVRLNRMGIGVPYQDKSNIRRRGHMNDLRCRGDTWFIPYNTVQNRSQKFYHPGIFPVELPLMCMKLHGKLSPRVLDPFMGTGTTLLAADGFQGRATGIELDKAYVRIAIQRLQGLAG